MGGVGGAMGVGGRFVGGLKRKMKDLEEKVGDLGGKNVGLLGELEGKMGEWGEMGRFG